MPKNSNHQAFRTRLSHAGRAGARAYGFVNPPLLRGSTVLYANMDERRAAAGKRLEQSLVYGIMGSETHFMLEDLIAEIEGGTRAQIVGSGLAAVTTPLFAYLKAGDHCLMTDSVYGPARNFCDRFLRDYGVETTYYRPDIDEAGIAGLIRSNTRVVYVESPGSHTFEVQDIRAIARAAHARGAKVLMDNTWGLHFFQPFTHGVDVSIQALTKYAGGHSDLMLGSVTVNSEADWETVRGTSLLLGQYASPDDCWLTLRGLRTLAIRLEAQMQSTLTVAGWLAERPEIQRVLYPALPGAPGHALWKRDFTGASSLFGVVFQPTYPASAVEKMVDAMSLFGIGASWGGFESLVLPTSGNVTRTVPGSGFTGPTMRLHIGLEDTADLIADLDHGLSVLRDHRSG